MRKTTFIFRVAAFASSAVVTFAIVAAAAQYALPAHSDTQLMVQAVPALVK